MPPQKTFGGVRSALIEQLLHLDRERRGGERLEDDRDARVKPTLMDDGIAGIPGSIEDFEPGMPTESLVGQLPTIHPAG